MVGWRRLFDTEKAIKRFLFEKKKQKTFPHLASQLTSKI